MWINNIGVFVWKGVGLAASFAVAVLAARIFGVESAGRLVLVQSTATVMATFSTLGIDTIAMRELAIGIAKKNYNEVRVITSSAIIAISLLLTVIVVVLMVRKYWFFSSIPISWGIEYSLIITIAVVGLVVIALFSGFLRAETRFNAVVWFQSACVSVVLIFSMLLSMSVGDTGHLIWLYPLSIVISAAVAILWWRYTCSYGLGRPSIHKAIYLLKSGLAVFFVSGGMLLIGWIEIVALHHWTGNREVALFGACQRIASIVGLPLALINISAGPRFATLHATGRLNELREYVFRIISISIVIGGAALLILALFGGVILSWYGSEFVIARRALNFLLAGQLVNAVTGPVLYLLMMCNKERTALSCVLIAVLLDSAGVVFLVPRWNLLGAAINCAIAMSMLNVLAAVFAYFYLFKKVR